MEEWINKLKYNSMIDYKAGFKTKRQDLNEKHQNKEIHTKLSFA
jgi:hypothetical protein